MLSHRALRVFADALVREPSLDGAGLDALCSEHPDLAADLRQLARESGSAAAALPRVASAAVKKLRAAPAAIRYLPLGEVARGGMGGIVLRVWDTVLDRPLAMKVLDTKSLPAHAGAADEALARFLAEARVAGRLQHSGIVPIHDLGADRRGRVYFTMPLFEGRTLDEVFDLARSRGEGWTLGGALRALAKVCEVMAYAHARGVVHRDLKPTNLIAGEFGEIYVVDWGLAKVVDPRASEAAQPPPEADADRKSAGSAAIGQTMEGTVAGTPPYMAPEQAEGRVAAVSFRADVYALGAMLYRLLAGRGPYAPRQGADEPEKTVELIRRGAPTPLHLLAPDAPPDLVAVCERAMARAPEDRHASVADVARDLHAFLARHADDSEWS
jgi:serine/threonine-protein kinase